MSGQTIPRYRAGGPNDVGKFNLSIILFEIRPNNSHTEKTTLYIRYQMIAAVVFTDMMHQATQEPQLINQTFMYFSGQEKT